MDNLLGVIVNNNTIAFNKFVLLSKSNAYVTPTSSNNNVQGICVTYSSENNVYFIHDAFRLITL